MTGWDESGLPRGAVRRLDRLREAGLTGGLQQVGDQASLAGLGFEPVGEVMGCTVMSLAWRPVPCSYSFRRGPYRLSGQVMPTKTEPFLAQGPYPSGLSRLYEATVNRLLRECVRVAGDGVVGVRLSVRLLEGRYRECSAIGTAVRVKSTVRSKRPFATFLTGHEVASLLLSGWVPVNLIVEPVVALWHPDARVRRRRSRWRLPFELPGPTELVTFARAQARQRFAERVRAAGADGALLSDISLTQGSVPQVGHEDRAATVIITGSGIAHFGAPSKGVPARPVILLRSPHQGPG